MCRPIRGIRDACGLIFIVNGISLAPGATERPHLGHCSVSPDEAEEVAARIVGCPHHHAELVNAGCCVPVPTVAGSQRPEVGHLSAAIKKMMIAAVRGYRGAHN